jgi:hypothetical protein
VVALGSWIRGKWCGQRGDVERLPIIEGGTVTAVPHPSSAVFLAPSDVPIGPHPQRQLVHWSPEFARPSAEERDALLGVLRVNVAMKAF